MADAPEPTPNILLPRVDQPVAIEVPAKSWYTSAEVWVNVVLAVAGLVQELAGAHLIPPEIGLIALPIANWAMRVFKTKQPISLLGEKTRPITIPAAQARALLLRPTDPALAAVSRTVHEQPPRAVK